MTFQRVCAVEDLGEGEGLKITDGDRAVALFNADGEFFAIQDRCSHGDWSLSDGYLDGDIVECSLHMGKFCVRNGLAVGFPATEPVAVYPVKIIDDEVFVDLDVDKTG